MLLGPARVAVKRRPVRQLRLLEQHTASPMTHGPRSGLRSGEELAPIEIERRLVAKALARREVLLIGLAKRS